MVGACTVSMIPPSPCSMCPELPIDVVYTWVNGSDHKLIRELRKLKRQLEKE